MKINTNYIFKEYRTTLVEDKTSLNKQKEDYENTKKYLLNKLEPFEHYLNHFTNIIYNDIKYLDRLIAEKSLIHLVDISGVDVNHIRRTLNIIVTINKAIQKIDEELTTIEADMIGNSLFRDILYKFNNKISDEIVYRGYMLMLGSRMGHIRIKKIDCRSRIRRRINWDLSNRKKAEILARGGTPYKVLEKNEAREVISHNEGEMWLVYFTNDFDYLWHWNKGRGVVMNSGYYKMRPTVYNNTKREGKLGNVNKLKQLVTANSPLLNNFLISHR